MERSGEVEFPVPDAFGKHRRWRLSDLLAFERALKGLPAEPPLDPSQERFLTIAMVRERYAVSSAWVWRRIGCRRATDRAAA